MGVGDDPRPNHLRLRARPRRSVRPVHVCWPTRGLAVLCRNGPSRSRGGGHDRSGACCAGDGVMEKHTPGPWAVDGKGSQAIVRANDLRIVSIRHRLDGDEHEANARLIAAAPELLEALQLLMSPI